MAELYAVEVLAKREREVILEVRMAHPDAPVPSVDPGSALMMLCESAAPVSILRNEIKGNSYVDSKWLMKNTRGFVADVKVLSRKKAAGKKRASAQLSIAVTDPAWIEHLAVGQAWASSAFDPTVFVAKKEYTARKPADSKKARALAKKAVEASRPVESPWTPLTAESVVMVPVGAWNGIEFSGKTCYLKVGDSRIKVPAEIPIPTYPADCYVGIDRIERPTPAQARALHGKLVRRYARDNLDVFKDGFVIAGPGDCPAWLMALDYNVYMLGTLPVTVLALKPGKPPKAKKLDQLLTAQAKESLARSG